MPPKCKVYCLHKADDNDHELSTVNARTVAVTKGHRCHLKIVGESTVIHQNPLYSQGDWVYQFDANDSYDAAQPKRVCVLKPPPPPRYNKSDWPLLYWTQGYRQEALEEFMQLEGRGDWAHLSESTWKQLIRAELFPATVDQPKTCTSFRVLEQYQALLGSGKMLAYKFHQGLSHMTDATGICKPKSKYTSLGCMVRQFAHIKMMKRGSRGNVWNGIKATLPGELATLCPACPHPGINLPADWESTPLEYKFLYILILALDANFHLKNLYRSSWDRDPGLHTGLAYFVEPTKYLKHVSAYVTQKDISNCSGFQTLSHAESKNAVGLRATGVGMCICACHEIVRPLGIGDLQKGEWAHGVQALFYSYDIACQWKINFFDRMRAFSKDWQIPDDIEVHFGIPKCHCKGYKRVCQCCYSMNIQRVGQMDGEGIERTWAEVNMVANSTKEMGPGNRFDRLDEQFVRHNWKKVIGLGRLLAKKHVKARSKAARHMSGFIGLTEVLPNKDFKAQWTMEIEAWERNKDLPSPYMINVKHLTENQVVFSLKEEERRSAMKDGLADADSNATLCVELGLIMEDAQYDICDQDDDVPLAASKDIQKKWKALHKDLTRLRSLQAEYMPCVKAKLWEMINDLRDVEERKLWLPSELDTALQCHLAGAKYNATRDALLSLKGPGQWEEELRVLCHSDMVSLHGSLLEINEDDEEEDAEGNKRKKRPRLGSPREAGEGHWEISWIWMQEGALGDGSNKDLNHVIKLEWLRSRAHAHRWQEECLLLMEEKRRILKTFAYEAECWDQRQSGWQGLGLDYAEGVQAYARRQADMYCRLTSKFRIHWDLPPEQVLEDNKSESEAEGEGEVRRLEGKVE
ncbi:hypothetical protein EDD18DRAFT_1115322 [Armillaria luteobubalina]|uniref:CxC2-like cysteine cluster KDZ transposase-associated domain-containing protein n=1 Tax=Armillaria luteobubalina TaxID=153913 RepID=A0AA39P2W5_9AGAR|nr:hypothetical protein EDD18DRAFT_1115322 [Armillaria luteobubalina]